MIPVQNGLGTLVGDFLESAGVPSEAAQPFGEAVVGAGLFVVAFAVLYLIGKRVALPLLDRVLDARNLDRHAKTPIRKFGWILYLFFGITVAFGVAGYNGFLRSLATIAAAATLAVGFAMQDVLKNFVAGVFIYTDEPFRTGDWIEWEGNSGYIEDLSLRVSRVRTFDNEHLTVPNSQLTDGVIKNYDKNRKLRVKFTFRISFEDDIDEATDIIVEEARKVEGILDDPEPSVRLIEINDASFGLQSRIWIEEPGQSDFLGIRGRFVQGVTERFDAEGITIPYPHRTVDGSLDRADAGVSDPAPDA